MRSCTLPRRLRRLDALLVYISMKLFKDSQVLLELKKLSTEIYIVAKVGEGEGVAVYKLVKLGVGLC